LNQTKTPKATMNLARYMSTEMIDLWLPPPEEPPDNPELNLAKFHQRQKERYLDLFVSLLENSGKVLHHRKLHADFVNRERKASTALERGIAIPHVRSRHVREVLIGFARSFEGIDFNSLDDNPSHLFFIIASPSQLSDTHLKIYKQLMTMFSYSSTYEELMEINNPGEVIRIIRQFD